MVEGDEHVRSASAQLLAIEAAARKGQLDARAMRELFRSIHTLKGLAAMVAVEPIVAITHRMEAALRPANQTGAALSPEAIDAALRGVDAIRSRLRQVSERKPVDPVPQPLLDRLDALDVALPLLAPPSLALDPELVAGLPPLEQQHLRAGLKSGMRAVRAQFVPSAERAAQGINITSVRGAVGKLGEIVSVLPVAAPTGLLFALIVLTHESDEVIAAAVGTTPDAVELLSEAVDAGVLDEATSTEGWGIIRVEVARLDEAMERLSALIVTRFRLTAAVGRLTAAGADTRELRLILNDNGRQLRDLRSAILKVRMVTLASVLDRVPLLFRGLKRSSGKQVRLEMDVGAAELDKGVAERLFPAIVHLIRNAVDHAIELPDVRRAAGKAEEGVVRISCTARSNTQLELVVSDDGGGIDAAKVAHRSGREVPGTDAGLLDLLCMPGLSTMDHATTTSGRGIGMDVVRRVAVSQLGGELLLATVRGKSTTFTLKVPLTISIVDAFALECGGERFLVPVSAVEEILELDPARLMQAPDVAGRGPRAVAMLERRGTSIPLMSLEALFHAGSGAGARKALVIRRGEEAMAFAVDRMLGQQEVVVRPLEDPLIRVLGVAGATDLGDGKPTLVLDLLTLTSSLLAAAGAKTEVVH